MAEAKTPANLLKFKCARCRTQLKVAMKFAGRFIECPKCKQKTSVPSTQEEADEEAKDYTVNEMAYEVPANCTKCGKKMKKGSVLCVHCGFDYKEGKQLDVVDTTVKEGEAVRGGMARNFMIVEFLLVLVGVGVLVFRAMSPQPQWWELGLYLSAIFFIGALAPMHLVLWLNFKEIPLRDHALKEQEDRDEREETQSPYGGKTGPILFLCAAAGMGFSYLGWGRGEGASNPLAALASSGPISIAEKRVVSTANGDYANYRRLLGTMAADLTGSTNSGALKAMKAKQGGGGDGSKVIVMKDDPAGEMIFLRVSISNKYLESVDTAGGNFEYFSSRDIELDGQNPVFLFAGNYEKNEASGDETSNIFGAKVTRKSSGELVVQADESMNSIPGDESGYVYKSLEERVKAVNPPTLKDNLWSVELQSHQVSGWDSAEIILLFPKPAGAAKLVLNGDQKNAVDIQP